MGGLGGVILIIALGIGGYHFYKQWQSRRLVHRAEAYISGGEFRSAALSARAAYQLNSSNAEACRLLAQIAEHDGQPSAVEWRRLVTTLLPDSAEDAIALARTALQFGNLTVAENTLKKLDGADQLSSYHDALAQLAIAKKNYASAEKELAEAVRLDPSNKLYQLNLAVMQLRSKTAEVRARASSLLHDLLQDAALRATAARALRDDAAQRGDTSEAVAISARLYSYPEATFRDRLGYVHILHALESREFAGQLTNLQNEAANDPVKLTDLISWMSNNRLSLVAIAWVNQLSPEIMKNPTVLAAVADCYVAARDWKGLQEWCKKISWGDLEFVRHAYLSRAFRDEKNDAGSRTEWNAAIQGAGSDGEKLSLLERQTVKWGWTKETEDVLWLLSKVQEKQDSALGALYQYYADKGESENLYRVVLRLSELKPDDDEQRNNVAQLSLLLNVNMERARELAEQLHQQDPKNAAFASTYAFSLYRQRRFQQAVKVMSDLSPEDLQRPEIAAYYGIFLAAARDPKAREFLDLGQSAQLLPEEKSLVQKARAEIEPN